VSLSTQYHDGNQAEFVRVLARSSLNSEWNELLPKQKMEGHSFLNLTLNPTTEIYSDIRVEMYPDGGLTRLGLYDELPQNENIRFSMQTCERFKNEIPKVSKPLIIKYEPTILGIKHNKERADINLAGSAFGAKILKASNEHYSPAVQLLSPYPAIHMFDGFESARSRQKDNFEDVTIELAEASQIKRIILDFEFFINNNPREVSIQGLSQNEWQTLVAKTNVKAYAGNKIEFKIQDSSIYTQVKIQIYPDGGINRLFVFAD
jgi:allantoicase